MTTQPTTEQKLRFTKKSVTIEAFQMTRERRMDNINWPEWLNEAWNKSKGESGSLFRQNPDAPLPDLLCIQTLEGVHLVQFDDWIIRGIKGELYPCKPDIFATTYEPAALSLPTQAEPVEGGATVPVWLAQELDGHARVVLESAHLAAISTPPASQEQAEPAAQEAVSIERKVYKDSDEHREYLSARFDQKYRTGVSFEWQGHRWAYRHTSFDDKGDYDLLWRPATTPQPAPASAELPDPGDLLIDKKMRDALQAIILDADSEPDNDYLDGCGKNRVAVHRKGIERARASLSAHGRAGNHIPDAGKMVGAELQDERDKIRLDALSTPGWELSENSDPERTPAQTWQVHRVSGGRNDREWTLIGEGETPRAAIDAAIASRAEGGL